MRLESPVFEHNGFIPRRYTCDGENINPPLHISNVPSGTKSLVLIMEDRDVPKHIRADGVWDHWIVYNIPSGTSVIEEGVEPEGGKGIGTSGDARYFGPCPPDGRHRYIFRLYALSKKLEFSSKPTKKQLLKKMEPYILAECELVGVYER